MAPGRDVDDLSQWAASRVPSLLARAEAEAVAVLRDALVDAALGGLQVASPARTREHEPRGGPTAPDPAPEPDTRELLWTYCVLRAGDPLPIDALGVAPEREVRAVSSGDLIALVSSVPRSEFGAEPLRTNLNDIAWLERVARAHEGVLDAALQMGTIVPLRMCTLYENDDGVRAMLEREGDAFANALARLEGRWEWAVKVLVDRDRLIRAAQLRNDAGRTVEEELEGHSEGGAYMARRRLERELRDSANALAAEVAQQVHARLQDWALDAITRPPQNRDLSGHEGEMLLNAAYLVDRDRAGELRDLVDELEARHGSLGVHIELTGPWPPYNFISVGGSTALA